MKKIIVILVIVFGSYVSLLAQWQVYQVVPFNDVMSTVNFTDSNTGYVGCMTGIYRTSNSGLNWIRVCDAGSTREIYFYGNIGYARCASGTEYILKTTDSGLTWSQQYTFFYGNVIGKIYVFDENETYVVCSIPPGNGSSWNLEKTTDGGLTYTDIFSTISEVLISGASKNNVTYAATRNNFWVNLNGTWQMYGNGDMMCYGNISFHNDKIYLVGKKLLNGSYTSVINSSTDQGVSWISSYLDASNLSTCQEIKFFENIGYALVNSYDSISSTTTGKIYKITGENWTLVCEVLNKEIRSMSIVENYIYVTVDNNVYRYDQSLTGLGSNTTSIKNFTLSQNFPNPFNPVTKINYSVPKNSAVTLKVYDITGKEISTLVNKNQSAGSYEANFDGSKLTSGVYFYRLTAGNFTETKKMILIK